LLCPFRPSRPPSPPVFFRISTHSTATPGIPSAPTVLQPGSRPRRSGVEPRTFTRALPRPPTRPLRPVIPDNARALRITAAAGTELAGASSPGTVNPVSTGHSSRATVVYTPKGVLPHAASLRQPCGHCARFPTAASRRSLGRLSVPMWLAILSDQLPVVALVGRHPHQRADRPRAPLHAPVLPRGFLPRPGSPRSVCGITRPLGRLSPASRQVAHVLRTRPPVEQGCPRPPVTCMC
jgi:hypothetical protein